MNGEGWEWESLVTTWRAPKWSPLTYNGHRSIDEPESGVNWKSHRVPKKKWWRQRGSQDVGSRSEGENLFKKKKSWPHLTVGWTVTFHSSNCLTSLYLQHHSKRRGTRFSFDIHHHTCPAVHVFGSQRRRWHLAVENSTSHCAIKVFRHTWDRVYAQQFNADFEINLIAACARRTGRDKHARLNVDKIDGAQKAIIPGRNWRKTLPEAMNFLRGFTKKNKGQTPWTETCGRPSKANVWNRSRNRRRN